MDICKSKDRISRATLGVVGGKKREDGVRILKNECFELSGDDGYVGKTAKENAACSRPLAARLDAVAGLPRQARGSRLRAHLNKTTKQNQKKMRLRNYKVYCKRTNPILSAPKVTKSKKKKKKRENSISQSK